MANQRVGSIFRPNRAALARTRTVWLSNFQDHGTVRDLVSGGVNTLAGTRIDTTEGPALQFLGGTGNGVISPVTPLTNNNNDIAKYAFIARVRATATQPGSPGAAFGLYASGAQGGLGIGFNSTNQIGAAWLSSSGAGLAGAQTCVLGQWYTVIVQGTPFNVTGGTFVWVQGGTRTEGSTSQGTIATAIDEVAIGAMHRSSGYLRQFRGDIAWAALLQNDNPYWMTDDIANELFASNYPFSLQTQARTIWLPLAPLPAINGSLSTTLASAVVTSTGVKSEAKAGTLAVTLQAATVSAQGLLSDPNSGSVNILLADASVSAQAQSAVRGALSTTLANSAVVATGANLLRGASAIALASATLTSHGRIIVTGSGVADIVLANSVVTAEGQSSITGEGSVSMANAILSAVGLLTAAPGGTAVIKLADSVVNSESRLSNSGLASTLLRPSTIIATGLLAGLPSGRASIALKDATVSASSVLALTGMSQIFLNNSVVVAQSVGTKQGSVVIQLASATLYATGGNPDQESRTDFSKDISFVSLLPADLVYTYRFSEIITR